jgi:hypothetical protein
MKLPISSGWWLAYCSIIDFVVGIANIFCKWIPMEYVSMAFCFVLSLPLWIPPLSKWVGIKLIWSKE